MPPTTLQPNWQSMKTCVNSSGEKATGLGFCLPPSSGIREESFMEGDS